MTSDANFRRKTIAKAKTRTPFRLSEELRKEMLSALSKEDPRLGFGGMEDENPVGTTARALKKILKEYPDSDLYYICGADKLKEIPKWAGIERMLERVSLLVFHRNGENVEAILRENPFWSRNRAHVKVSALTGDCVDVSSTEVRCRFMAGEDYRELLAPSTYDILSRLSSNDFPPLTQEEVVEATLRYDGRFGPSTARGLVYKDNRERFRVWDKALFGDRGTHLSAKVYRQEFHASVGQTYDTVTDCVNADCVEIASKLLAKGLHPAILNLASNVHPCGGYHAGSRAQEESLCYSSTLSQTLYQFGNPKEKCVRDACVQHVEDAYPLEQNFGGIYAPCVRFFRENEAGYYRLRTEPFDCAVISVASLANRPREDTLETNALFFREDGSLTKEGIEIEKNKIRTIFRIALDNRHDSIVLGAFGCGAYHLLPDDVSRLFAEVLAEDAFRGAFRTLVFAIYEGKGSRRKPVGKDGRFAPFYNRFARE